jgi:ABC-type antimicrobial peptide transport system permease subunit
MPKSDREKTQHSRKEKKTEPRRREVKRDFIKQTRQTLIFGIILTLLMGAAFFVTLALVWDVSLPASMRAVFPWGTISAAFFFIIGILLIRDGLRGSQMFKD